MASVTGSSLLFLANLVLYVTCDDGIVILTNQQRQELLDAHNYWRRTETTANNMRLMRWDCKLEEFAIEWLKKCTFDHSPQSMRLKPDRFGFWYVGENMLTRSHSEPNMNLPKNLTEAHQGYYDEINYYNFKKNTCQPGKVCGHYTQVVWWESYALGCGLTRCAGSNPKFKSHAIMSCVYGPGGNVGGKRPYTEGGKPCSGCVKGKKLHWEKHCIEGLCSDTATPPPLPKCTFAIGNKTSLTNASWVFVVFLNVLLSYLP